MKVCNAYVFVFVLMVFIDCLNILESPLIAYPLPLPLIPVLCIAQVDGVSLAQLFETISTSYLPPGNPSTSTFPFVPPVKVTTKSSVPPPTFLIVNTALEF